MNSIYALIDPITNECRYIGKTRMGKSEVKKKKGPFTVDCQICYKPYASFLVELPNKFICPNCGVAQQIIWHDMIPFTKKRDYPLGFWR